MAGAGLRHNGRPHNAVVRVNPDITASRKHQHTAESRQGGAEILGVVGIGGFFEAAVRTPDLDSAIEQEPFARIGDKEIAVFPARGQIR